jgi:hypothetical protein
MRMLRRIDFDRTAILHLQSKLLLTSNAGDCP